MNQGVASVKPKFVKKSSKTQTFRHMKALMHKNAINWRRTWKGSIFELLCPALLMLVLVWIRTLIDIEISEPTDVYREQVPLYPPVSLDVATNKWVITPTTINQQGNRLNSFMNYTQYSTGNSYDPMNDPQSPYAFIPEHCFAGIESQKGGQSDSGDNYNSPIVAVVTQSNVIEDQLIDQLNVLFEAQKLQSPLAAELDMRVQTFASKDELFDYIGDGQHGQSVKPGICFAFRVYENSKSDYELELFFQDLYPSEYESIPSQKVAATNPSQKAPMKEEYNKYLKNGYSMFQNWAANTILKSATNKADAQITVMVVPIRSNPVPIDFFQLVLGPVFPFFLQISFIPLLYRMINRVVNEKATRAKESMRMMGMGDASYWISWFIQWTLSNTVLTTLMWAILMINCFSKDHGGVVWLFMWLFGQSLFGLLVLAQSLFSKAKEAATVTTLLYFATTLIQTLFVNDDTTQSTKIYLSWFFPTLTMINGAGPLVDNFQVGGIGSITLLYQNFSVSNSLWLFVVGGFNILIIGLYLEYVLPKTYGRKRHPCFFLMCCCKKKNKQQQVSDAPADEINDDEKQSAFETKYMDKGRYEGVPRVIAQREQDNKILKISDLKKTFENGLKAVEGINLKMYSDQIFVLLGHNGAGKTTTINMLTGLYEQSEGHAELFGIDVFNDMNAVRQVMGVCPQHDVLFELLTTEEHLSIFYDLKGADPKLKKAEIEKLMKDVGIYDKKNALASQLSGGNKRKLSVAIALCGNSKFVLLDEPTSGMDLSARRQLWNMLKEYKKDRIILLTTHYMDEADILGDRIGIMTSGKVTALGSSIFLKSTFGVGYNLTVVKSNSDKNVTIMPYIQENLGENVIQQSEIQLEMTLQIPTEYAPKFAQFFQKFDLSLEQLGIESYGIGISTLEEVFLKVGHLDDKDKPSIIDGAPGLEKKLSFNMKDQQDQLDNSFISNLQAIMYRKFSNYRRNKKTFFGDTVIPALLLILGIAISKIQPTYQSPSRIQSPDRLPLPQQLMMNPLPVQSGDTSIQTLVSHLGDSFSIVYDSDWNATTTYNQYGESVYDSRRDTYPYMYGSYQIFEVDRASQQYKFMTFINQTSQDATGLYPGFMYESILKTATQDSNFRFAIRSTPYPPTYRINNRADSEETNTVLFQMAIAYSIVIVAVVNYLVTERMDGLKHLQIISGMQLKAYWVGNFLFDTFKFTLLIITTIILWFAFSMEYNTAWLTVILCPLGILPFTYFTSFLFSSASGAQTVTLLGHIVVLGILVSVIFTLRIIPTQQTTGDIMHGVFKIIPTYMIGSSMYCDKQCQSLADTREFPFSDGKTLEGDPWAMSNAPFDCLMMLAHFAVWSILLITIEIGLFKICRLNPNAKVTIKADDTDVIQEADRVKTSEVNDTIILKDFKKVFKTKASKACRPDVSLVAVSDLSFGLKQGECFALLGVNGAGKTTTFKSLTGEVQPTKGSITVGGYDIRKDFDKVRKLIGYCPQQDLIYEDMTVEEHLKFYVQLKGIPAGSRVEMVEDSIKQLGLQTHRKKSAGTLSGGNKRKLCVAIALIGSPQIILLDEPSAGMDPESRRFMWSVVGKIAQKKTSAVVLTTHSMDEAEALSTKMGIMVKGGVFQCYGSAQHIKNKYGTGYVIEIKIKTLGEEELDGVTNKYLPPVQGQRSDLSTHPVDETDNYVVNAPGLDEKVLSTLKASLKDLNTQERAVQVHSEVNLYGCISELCRTFGQVEVLDKYGSYMRVRVARIDKSIGFSFGLVEQMRGKFDVSEYSVSQTTLEQIFQSFADVTFDEKVVKFELKENAARINVLTIV